jgi:integrase/recombinase XerD
MTHLRKMMLEELERRNYAQTTIHSYLRAVAEFSLHFHRPPNQLGPDHIRQYQAHLLGRRKLAPSTVTQRLAALRFFYIKTLRKPWSIAETPYPKKVQRLPIILSAEEVAQLIDSALTPFHHIVLMTLYATGVRRAELTRLKITDIDSRRMIIHIQGGKGRKDRDVMLSPTLLKALREYWRGLRRKPTDWLFPGGRWHTANHPITPKVVWNACQKAAQRAGIHKKIHPHTLRHYLPFLTMSSDMEWSGDRSIITGPNANRVDQSPDIVFSVFSVLQTIKEAKQLVSRLVAPRSAVRR